MSAQFKANQKQLVIGISVAVLLIVAGLIKGALKTSNAQATVPVTSVRPAEDKYANISTVIQVQDKIQAERKAKALASIAEHENIIAVNSRAEDVPDRLMGIGNLYQYQLGDNYSAITSYRNLIARYPDHAKAPDAYIEIAKCYEVLGNETQANYVYQEMIDSLDPSLQHVKYAKMKLGKQ